MGNKHGLGKHLTDFFVPNKDLLLKSGRLIIIGPKAINAKIMQMEENSAFTL